MLLISRYEKIFLRVQISAKSDFTENFWSKDVSVCYTIYISCITVKNIPSLDNIDCLGDHLFIQVDRGGPRLEPCNGILGLF